MEIATSIYLFLMSGMRFSLDYWAFSLVHVTCKLQSAVVRIIASLLYLRRIGVLEKDKMITYLHDPYVV